ncbi:hypothetical protein BDR06DRAFT_947641 [Suillus hirtellus]|nr:hypothetical protein BDR06DRAFT_947641 [Suillus hirtellus]
MMKHSIRLPSDQQISNRHSVGLVSGRRIMTMMAVFIARSAHVTYSSFLFVLKQTLIHNKARVDMLQDPCADSCLSSDATSTFPSFSIPSVHIVDTSMYLDRYLL